MPWLICAPATIRNRVFAVRKNGGEQGIDLSFPKSR